MPFLFRQWDVQFNTAVIVNSMQASSSRRELRFNGALDCTEPKHAAKKKGSWKKTKLVKTKGKRNNFYVPIRFFFFFGQIHRDTLRKYPFFVFFLAFTP